MSIKLRTIESNNSHRNSNPHFDPKQTTGIEFARYGSVLLSPEQAATLLAHGATLKGLELPQVTSAASLDIALKRILRRLASDAIGNALKKAQATPEATKAIKDYLK